EAAGLTMMEPLLKPKPSAGAASRVAPALGVAAPTLLVPYMWIGDFVRCPTVIKILNARFPDSPVDVLTTPMVAPLPDYMPDVRKGVVWDLPRKRLALSQQLTPAERLPPQG